MIITKETLFNYEQRYRTQLVNSLNGYKSANLIGSQNKLNQSNLAIFSSVIHLGSNPPLIGFITRPNSVPRHTLENIKETGKYTINHIHSGIIEAAHQTSARYKREKSEFVETGLTEEYIDNFTAPFVKEAHLKMGLQVKEVLPITTNDTLLIVGEIELISLPETCLETDGKINLELLNTVVISGLDMYHSTKKETRLSYAKPDLPLRVI